MTVAIAGIATLVASIAVLVVRWRQHHNRVRDNARIMLENNEVLRATSIALNETKLATIGNIEAQLRYTETLMGAQEAEKAYNEFEIESFKDRLANVHPEDELGYEKISTTIQQLATKLCNIKVNGRKPSVFAVSCIFLATNMVGQRYLGEPLITKEEISRYLKTPSTTLREHTRYVQTHLKMNL